MSDSLPSGLDALIARARDADGQPPFSDGSLVELVAGERELVWIDDDAQHVGAAVVKVAEAELVIDPDARRRGHGRALLHQLLVAAPGDLLVWAHGDHPGSRALARAFGMPAVRTLLQLRAPVDRARRDPEPSSLVGEVSTSWTRGIRGHEDAWVELNARTFAGHPEQGAVTRQDLDLLMAERWFDADDFLLLWDGEDLVGYCWLKVEGGIGEFYVVGVSPDRQGLGLGKQLVAAGLDRLREKNIHTASLYVEGDNTAALRLYRGFGFEDHSIDIQYRWRSEPYD